MLILHNAKIYTFDDHNPNASAIVVDKGRIKAVGNDHELLSAYKGIADELNVAGHTIIPGLIDSHFHLEQYALGLHKVDCDTRTRAECVSRVADRARNTPPGEWLLGHGWNQNNWSNGYGSVKDLDSHTPNTPVYLTAKSLHAAWINSTALLLSGISTQTPDPPGGRIGRDEHGNPTGILFENAMELVTKAIPEPSLEQVTLAIQNALPSLYCLGLTGVHDFDRRRCFIALQKLHDQGMLRLRVVKSIPIEDLPHAVALGLRTGFGDEFLRIGGVKAFADGALGPRTAAMLQPYDTEPYNKGMLLLDSEELFEHGRTAVKNGLSLAIHAIGDRANHEILNGFERLREYERTQGRLLRHRIEHVQLIHPMDAQRLAKLDIIASMQPIHATADMEMAERYWSYRASYSYAWRTQLNYGTTLAFGSDAPVETPNPFYGLHAAITRRRTDGNPGINGWYPDQRLTVTEAIRAYTYGAAFAAGLEDRLGKLASGYFADLVILDTDPFTCEPDEIFNIRLRATMIGGELVYQR